MDRRGAYEKNKFPFPCEGCSRAFTNAKALNVHEVMSNHHPCPEPTCNNSFETATAAQKHQETRHNPCHLCLVSVGGKKQVVPHFKTVHKPKICKTCAVEFLTVEDLREHLAREGHEEMGEGDSLRYGCHVCGMLFERNYSLDLHMDVHLGLKCEGCGEEFARKKKYEEHVDPKKGLCGAKRVEMVESKEKNEVRAVEGEMATSEVEAGRESEMRGMEDRMEMTELDRKRNAYEQWKGSRGIVTNSGFDVVGYFHWVRSLPYSGPGNLLL